MLRAARARPTRAVIALGGGALGSERVREALARHTVVHLEVEPDDGLAARLRQGPAARARPRPLRRSCTATARAVYESVADAVLPPADRDALRRALPALRALGEAPAGTRLVWAAARRATTRCSSAAA